jgi:glycosyltransferase involved in cell wall biosynthesis
MLDLLIVARGAPADVGSTRYRVCQFLPYLTEAGIRFRLVVPPRRRRDFFYLWPLFYIRIFVWGMQAHTILVQKDIHFLPLWRMFKWFGKRLLYDFDDAIFVEGRPGQHHVQCWTFPSKPAKQLVGDMICIADHVTVANNFLRDFARQFSTHVEVFPMPVDLDQFPQRQRAITSPVVIGWIGTAQTAPYLSLLQPVFQYLLRTYPGHIKIRIITRAVVPFHGIEFEQRPWSFATEAEDILAFDIGVVPLPSDDPLAEGKSSYKLLQFMASGLPVVSSRVGYNKDIVVDGENGFLVRTTEEWIAALECLIQDPDLRRRIGPAARETIRKECSLETLVPRFLTAVSGFQSNSRSG